MQYLARHRSNWNGHPIRRLPLDSRRSRRAFVVREHPADSSGVAGRARSPIEEGSRLLPVCPCTVPSGGVSWPPRSCVVLAPISLAVLPAGISRGDAFDGCARTGSWSSLRALWSFGGRRIVEVGLLSAEPLLGFTGKLWSGPFARDDASVSTL